jgi:hypothetical protein
MSGQGAVDAGALEEVELVTTPAGVEDARGVEVVFCSHLVQIVDVLVTKIVLVETPTDVVVKPLDV